jgi:hypothetical protein
MILFTIAQRVEMEPGKPSTACFIGARRIVAAPWLV